MSDDATKDTPEPNEEPVTPAAESKEVTPAVEGEEEEFTFVEDPIFEVDYKGDCAYEVKVTIPIANEHKLSDDVFEKLRHDAEVPGFRRGRAPRKLIERKFAKAVRNDVESKLVQSAFTKLMKDKDLKPLAPPDADWQTKPEDRKPEDPIAFTLTFEVQPRVELGKYRGVEVERPIFKVEEKDIEDSILSIRSRYAVYETVEDGEAASGDQVIISFKGKVGGEEFPGGTAENYPYILGTKRFFPEFEAVLVGSRPGSTLTCDVTFPEQYTIEHLQGKTATFEIRINELKRRNIPDLTDEFARQSGFEGIDDMRAKVAAQLQEGSEAESNEIAESRALKTVIESSTYEIPKSLIENMANDFYEESVKDMRTRRIPASQIQEHEEQLRADAHAEAINAIKSWTTLNEVVDVEGIEVTDEDFEKEAAALSRRTGVSAEAVAKVMDEDEHRNRYERRIMHVKVLQAVMSHATITDKEVSREEFERAEAD